MRARITHLIYLVATWALLEFISSQLFSTPYNFMTIWTAFIFGLAFALTLPEDSRAPLDLLKKCARELEGLRDEYTLLKQLEDQTGKLVFALTGREGDAGVNKEERSKHAKSLFATMRDLRSLRAGQDNG